MTRVMQTVIVNANTGQVFRFLMDPNNLPKFLPISRVEVLEQTASQTKIKHDFQCMGKTLELVSVGDSLEGGRKVRYRCIEGPSVDNGFTLADMRGQTKITYMLDYQPIGGVFAKLLDKWTTRKDMEKLAVDAMQKLQAAFAK